MSRAARWRWSLVGGLLILLEVLCRTGVITPITMVPPTVMVVEAFRLLGSAEMAGHFWHTLRNVLIAIAIAVCGGFVAGSLIHRLPRLRRILDPVFASWYAVPMLIFYPVLIVVFGMNDIPLIIVGFLFAFVAMIINTLAGLDRIPRVLRKTGQVMTMPPWKVALLIDLPASLPWLFTGIRLAIAYCFIGVIGSEFILAAAGIGHQISYAYNNFETEKMYALMLIVLVVVGGVNVLLDRWNRRILERQVGS